MQSAEGERPTNIRWLVFALCCASSWFLYLHRYTFALIKPELAKEWNVDLVELGAMDTAFSIAYSGCQVPTGLIADLLGTHLFLGGIILAWSGSLMLHIVAPGQSTMYGIRMLFGTTQAGCYPSLGKITQTWFPRSIRTTLQGWIASFFGRAGGASANIIFATVLMGWLALDWRTAMVALSVVGAVFGVALLLLFRSTPSEHPWVNEAERRLIDEGSTSRPSDRPPDETKRLTAMELIRSTSPRSLRNFGYLLIQQFTSTFADVIYLAWVPFFLRVEHNLEYTAMGIFASLPLFGGAFGGMAGGFLNDSLIHRTGSRRWSRSAVGCCGKGVACALIFVALMFYDRPYAFCVVLFFVKFFSDWSQPTVWGTVTDISGKAGATVFGFNNGVGGLGGLIAPIIFGYVAQVESWALVFAIVGGAYLVSSVSWLFVNCTIPLMAADES